MPRTDLGGPAGAAGVADDTRRVLREWVASRQDGAGIDLDRLDDLDGIPLFGERLLTSVHFPELILLVERLRGGPVDVASLTAADVATIDAIVERFFASEPGG